MTQSAASQANDNPQDVRVILIVSPLQRSNCVPSTRIRNCNNFVASILRSLCLVSEIRCRERPAVSPLTMNIQGTAEECLEDIKRYSSFSTGHPPVRSN